MNNKTLSFHSMVFAAVICLIDSRFSYAAVQEPSANEHTSDHQPSDHYSSFSEEPDWLDRVWGRPFSDHIYLGIWTQHFQPGDDQENTNNLISFTYKGYFAGTFRNTHSDQVVACGWHRALYENKWNCFNVEAGYRLGLMHGYKKCLPALCPLPQAVIDIDYKGFGVEFTWAGVVVTGGFYYRL